MLFSCPSCQSKHEVSEDTLKQRRKEAEAAGTGNRVAVRCKKCGVRFVVADGRVETAYACCPSCRKWDKLGDKTLRLPAEERSKVPHRCTCGAKLRFSPDSIGSFVVVTEDKADVSPVLEPRPSAKDFVVADCSEAFEHESLERIIETWAPEPVRALRRPPHWKRDILVVALLGIPFAGSIAAAFFAISVVVLLHGVREALNGDVKTLIGALIGSPIFALMGFMFLHGAILKNWPKRVPIVTEGVVYELTKDYVRVRVGPYRRELLLSDIDKVECLPEPKHNAIGHVVFYRRGMHKNRPTILPAGVTKDGTANSELAFWLVRNPQLVRDRVLDMKSRLDSSMKGPYR